MTWTPTGSRSCSSLTLLRQLSLHGALIDDAHLDLPCAKIDLLLSQLQDVAAGGHRALVFSQFTRFLGRVRERLEAAGMEYCYLDGKTRDRAAEVARFKDGAAPAFLISLKAGGFGLNLTEADYCFLLDPWWNPATEAQAVDRTHRIGQSRNVMVYRLISAGTIEEKVLALQARKAELFTSVLDSGGVFSGSLDADDIRALFTCPAAPGSGPPMTQAAARPAQSGTPCRRGQVRQPELLHHVPVGRVLGDHGGEGVGELLGGAVDPVAQPALRRPDRRHDLLAPAAIRREPEPDRQQGGPGQGRQQAGPARHTGPLPEEADLDPVLRQVAVGHQADRAAAPSAARVSTAVGVWSPPVSASTSIPMLSR